MAVLSWLCQLRGLHEQDNDNQAGLRLAAYMQNNSAKNGSRRKVSKASEVAWQWKSVFNKGCDELHKKFGEATMTRIYTPEEKRRLDKIKAAAQKVKQGRVKVYSKEEKKLFDSLKQVCANVVIDKANCVRRRANEIDEQNYIKQMQE